MTIRRRQRGYLLITVVVTLFLLATVAVLLTKDSAISANSASAELEAARADYVAQAGMQHALWQTHNDACMGNLSIPATALGRDSYDATVTGAAAGTSYMLNADQDAWIRNDDVTKNNGTTINNHIRQETGKVEQVLTRFDISTLPADAQINSAVAWFHLKALKPHPEGPINVHEITADWAEASVTWDSFASAYHSAIIGIIPAQDTGDVWVGINLTGLVQAWVNGQPNYGILFESQAEGVHAEYVAREDGTNPPRLEVVVGSGEASPVTITATGTLDNGVKRKLKDTAATAYQPATWTALQPDASGTDDSWITAAQTNWSYGAHDNLRVQPGNQRTLLRMDLQGHVPIGARVTEARLELYADQVNTADAIDLHGISRSWAEGTCIGNCGPNDGATWDTYDGAINWATLGGDFDSAAAATAVPLNAGTWVSWDITELVAAWMSDPSSNNGVMFIGNPGRAVFLSSDDANPALRPRMTIRYACECGSPCMAPQGAGNILMVIGNSPGNPSADEIAIQEFLENWGYSVSLIQDDDSQGNYDAAIAANDVVFVSETVTGNNVNTKLTGTSTGVVIAERNLLDDLGIATASSTPTGSTIDVIDNSHYISSVFQPATLQLKTADTQLPTVAGTVSSGAQVLANVGGDGSLVAVDTGAASTSGGTIAGRRVFIPVGEGDVSWDYLTNAGRLIVQRSLDWAMGAGSTVADKILFVVGNSSTPSARDAGKKSLMESWDYEVTLLDDDADESKFKESIQGIDVVYVSGSVAATSILVKLSEVAIPLVNEESDLKADYGFSENEGYNATYNALTTDNSHYITEPFASGGVVPFTSNILMWTLNGTMSDDLMHAGQIVSAVTVLATLDAGDRRWDGPPVPARRVQVPFENANVSDMTADGQTLMRRSIEWAGGSGPDYGLIAHWKLDEGTGLIAEDSVGGHDGTLLNGPTWAGGAIGGGVHFSDESHAVSVPHSDSLTITGDLTLLAWVNLDELRPNRPIIQKGTDNIDHNYFFGLYNDNVQFAVSPPGGGWHVKTSGPTGISPGSWHHLAVSFDDSINVVVFYLDGVPFAKQELTHSPSEFAGPLKIGRNRFNYGIKGSVDDVRIYRDVLSHDEVAALAARPPIAHWKFDETSGVTAVDSAGGHDGTLVNGPSWATGHLDGALDFDGSNDFVDVLHDDSLSLTGAMSFTSWINTSSFSFSYQTIVAKDAGGQGSNYYFGTWQQELVFGFFAGGTFREVFTSGLNLQPGNWYHVAASFDDSTGQVLLYVNGSQVRDGTLSFSPTAVNSMLRLGRSPDGERWRGLLDDVRIYDRALSESEIADLYNEASGGPVAHWKLDDGTGTTAIDSEGGYHGTLINGPVWVAGQIGDALDFDGSNDLVSVPHQAVFTQVPMAVSAWFKLNTLPTTRSEHGTIIDKRHTVDPYASWTLYVNEALGNKIRFQIRDSSETGYWLDSAASAVTNTWYHVVGTIDESYNAKLYVNGALEPDDDNIGSLFSSNDEIRIGAGWSGGNRLDGVVDDVRFYDRALSATEISGLYTAGTGGGGGGGGGGAGGGCNGPFTDTFDAVSYSGGSTNWKTDWQETGETTSPSGGDIRINDDVSNFQLMVRDDGQTVWREVDLSAATSATLSFDYRRQGLNGSSDYVAVEVSYDGGSNWFELDRFIGTATDSSYLPYSKALDSNSLSDSTRIRFLTPNSGMGNNNIVWFDDIEITCTP